MKWLVSYFSSVEYLPLCRTGITSVQYYYYQQWYWNTAGSNKFKKRWKQRRHSNCRIKYWSQHSESQTHTHTHTPYPLLMGVKHSVFDCGWARRRRDVKQHQRQNEEHSNSVQRRRPAAAAGALHLIGPQPVFSLTVCSFTWLHLLSKHSHSSHLSDCKWEESSLFSR